MKNIILFFVCIVFSVSLFSAEYEFKNIVLPKSFDCNFDINIKYSQNEVSEENHNTINVSVTESHFASSGISYKTHIENRGKIDNFDRDIYYIFSPYENRIKVLSSSDEDLYPRTLMSPDVLSSQFVFPGKSVSVGDVWYTEICNPFDNKKITVENRLSSVINNLATVSFVIRNPYRDADINTNRELFVEKIKDGSSFYFKIDRLAGNAEICGAGVWFYDLKKQFLLSSEQFFKITALMRYDDMAEIKSINDFFYIDLYAVFKYNFKAE